MGKEGHKACPGCDTGEEDFENIAVHSRSEGMQDIHWGTHTRGLNSDCVIDIYKMFEQQETHNWAKQICSYNTTTIYSNS